MTPSKGTASFLGLVFLICVEAHYVLVIVTGLLGGWNSAGLLPSAQAEEMGLGPDMGRLTCPARPRPHAPRAVKAITGSPAAAVSSFLNYVSVSCNSLGPCLMNLHLGPSCAVAGRESSTIPPGHQHVTLAGCFLRGPELSQLSQLSRVTAGQVPGVCNSR